VAVAPRPQLAQVGHREGLTAGHIHVALEADVRDTLGADFVDERVQLRNIDVAFERIIRLGGVGLVDDDVDKPSAGQFLVQARGREIHVAGHVVAILDQDLRHQVLGAASLVCRHEVLVAIVLLHHGFEVVEILAAGIGLVAEHHAGPLPIAHCGGARVGQQVDVYVAALRQERVVAGLADGLESLLARGHAQEFDHLDLVGLGPGVVFLLVHGAESKLWRPRLRYV
jgi:hypothetical protein